MANGWILKNHSQTKVDLTNLERLLTLNKMKRKENILQSSLYMDNWSIRDRNEVFNF